MGLRKILEGKRVYFDANIFIYLLEGNEVFEPAVSVLRDLIAEEQITVTSSDLVYTEVLAHKRLVGDTAAIEHIIGFIGNFEIHRVTEEVAIHAGILRGETGMKAPDALHVAGAIHNGSEVVLTNDGGIKTPNGIQRIVIGEYV